MVVLYGFSPRYCFIGFVSEKIECFALSMFICARGLGGLFYLLYVCIMITMRLYSCFCSWFYY